MSTHIEDNAVFAKTVLMPGDPIRAKRIAETFLKDYKQVTGTRGILGFTGHTQDGREISVMASGMGIPSIGIYSYELFTFYGVENIIRIGTCGSYSEECHVGDVIIATGASTNSNYGKFYEQRGLKLAPASDFSLAFKAHEAAKKLGIPVHVGPIYSSDVFYDADDQFYKIPQEVGILGVEMESYGLFLNAMRLRKKAACLLTVSDSFVHKDEPDMTKEERSNKLINMVKIALELAE